MKPRGGTELLYSNLKKYVQADWAKFNLLLSFCHQGLINPNKINVMWQHLYTDQGAITGMSNQNFIDAIQHFVWVSNWQMNQFKEKYDLSNANNHVIKNAIEPIPYMEKPTDRLRLIYTSMPNRGLEILLDAFPLVQRDVELVIYSSNIIYGKGYHDMMGAAHDQLFVRAKAMKNVIYKGYVMNKAIRLALQQSHILAYPSIFPETSCLAAIEAGAAGCKIVTTDFGALPETCGEYATYVPYTMDRRALAHTYAQVLTETIDTYQNNMYNQSNWFNTQYSWENRKHEWEHLLA